MRTSRTCNSGKRALLPVAVRPFGRLCAFLLLLRTGPRIGASTSVSWAATLVKAAVAVASFGAHASPSHGGPKAAPFDLLPPTVVVHGRRGKNSNINGVYTLDFTRQQQVGPCYQRSNAAGQTPIFLYFEGEWRMGPSPHHGSVWAFARSAATSPLLIDVPWEVWDGRRVKRDMELRVSDTSAISSVLFLSFSGGEVPAALRPMQGMLLQQPGLWDGRPYYRHQAWSNLYLLCSVAEGRWRLGPLPLAMANTQGADAGPSLFAASAAALPQEIAERWHVATDAGGHLALGDGVVRLAATSSVSTAGQRRHRHPRHLVVEGVEAGGAIANGVYRLAKEESGYRPVYRKTDPLRAAALWFSGGAWCLGAAAPEGPAWVCSASGALWPLGIDAPWRSVDWDNQRQKTEAAHLAEATQAIPRDLVLLGESYVHEHQLCDARPVYRRISAPDARGGETDEQDEVYLFFRAHEGEWWLGPVVGGTECIARAAGSRIRVIPDPEELVWRAPSAVEEAQTPPPLPLHWSPAQTGESQRGGNGAFAAGALGDMSGASDGWDLWATRVRDADQQQRQRLLWWSVAAATVLVACISRLARGVTRSDEAVCCSGGQVPADASRDTVRLLLPCDKPRSASDVVQLAPEHAAAATRGRPLARRRRTSDLACVVCFEAPRQILLMPCRHVCCCKACADRLERCPMCRTDKLAFTQVFL